MIIDYDKIEKIHFLNKDFDHDFNIKVLKTFENLFLKTLELKIDFVVTGGFGSLLYYKKIYRKIEDIDLLINRQDIEKWFLLFKDNYDFCYEEFYEFYPAQRLKDFFNKKVESLIFKDNEHQVKIEIITRPCFDYKEVEFNNYFFKVAFPNFSYENKLKFKRPKDVEDWKFFNKYLVDSK